MGQLTGKVALITGGSRGIGEALVRKYVTEGCAVAFTYASSSERSNKLVDELNTDTTQVKAYKSDASNFDDLSDLFTLGAQKYPAGLGASFLEKDIWVTEILRLLYDEGLVGDHAIAFKGGTALSKCWNVIERFSEDIDLSIH